MDDGSRVASIDGLEVRFKRAGSGPVLVALHGSGSSLDTFDAISDRLEHGFDVIRPDLPGFGVTGPRPDRDYKIETYVGFLDRFLDDQQVGPAILVGNSLGGNIAWNFAVGFPARVTRLVLLNATGYPGKSLPPALRLARNPVTRPLLALLSSRRATARSLQQAVGPGFTVPQELIDRTYELMRRPGNREAFMDFASTYQEDHSGALKGLKMPTLILRGEQIDGQHFARDVPDSRELVLAGVGHLMPDEAPEAVAEAIVEFAGSP